MTVCKAATLSWFKLLPAHDRIDFTCSLLQLCLPTELRYLGTCIEGLARKDYPTLREAELTANKAPDIESTGVAEATGGPDQELGNPAVEEVRARLAVYLSLLHSSNLPCATRLANCLLVDWVPVVKALVSMPTPEVDKSVREDILLVYTLAVNHPAFKFDQRQKLFDLLFLLHRLIHEANAIQALPGQINSPDQSVVPVDVSLRDIRILPSQGACDQMQHPSFLIEVTWMNNIVTQVTKSIAEFHHLNGQILASFSDQLDSGVLPLLNIQRFLSLAGEKTSDQLLPQLLDYLKQLLKLPSSILSAHFVRDFFLNGCTVVTNTCPVPVNLSLSYLPLAGMDPVTYNQQQQRNPARSSSLPGTGEVQDSRMTAPPPPLIENKAYNLPPLTGLYMQLPGVPYVLPTHPEHLLWYNKTGTQTKNRRHMYTQSGKPNPRLHGPLSINSIPIPSPGLFHPLASSLPFTTAGLDDITTKPQEAPSFFTATGVGSVGGTVGGGIGLLSTGGGDTSGLGAASSSGITGLTTGIPLHPHLVWSTSTTSTPSGVAVGPVGPDDQQLVAPTIPLGPILLGQPQPPLVQDSVTDLQHLIALTGNTNNSSCTNATQFPMDGVEVSSAAASRDSSPPPPSVAFASSSAPISASGGISIEAAHQPVVFLPPPAAFQAAFQQAQAGGPNQVPAGSAHQTQQQIWAAPVIPVNFSSGPLPSTPSTVGSSTVGVGVGMVPVVASTAAGLMSISGGGLMAGPSVTRIAGGTLLGHHQVVSSCFNCGGTGHLATECRQPTVDTMLGEGTYHLNLAPPGSMANQFKPTDQ